MTILKILEIFLIHIFLVSNGSFGSQNIDVLRVCSKQTEQIMKTKIHKFYEYFEIRQQRLVD